MRSSTTRWGGRKIAVTWCPLGYTGIVYSREAAGRELTLSASGKLIMNSLVMSDGQTGSLWSQMLGEAVDGPLAGTRLEFLPSQVTVWEDWRARHPDTLALAKGYAGGLTPYMRYYASPDEAGIMGEAREDDRLATKDLVYGVATSSEAVAYPHARLARQPVVNDRVEDTPVLVVYDPDTRAAAAFDRRARGEELTFTAKKPGVLSDAETGSTWDGLAGVATAGPLTGARLLPVKGLSAYWFAWKDWYPATRVWAP